MFSLWTIELVPRIYRIRVCALVYYKSVHFFSPKIHIRGMNKQIQRFYTMLLRYGYLLVVPRKNYT